MSSFSFVHTADLHLGYKQYGLIERFRDYGDVFSEAANFAIENDSDFFLISGDIFDDRNIDASTFSQAHRVLKNLRENDISVFAIEGNHDEAFYSDGMSWLEALDYQGLVNLIKVKSKGKIDLLGDYREFEVNKKEVRVFGLKYVGARTKKLLRKVKDEIQKINQKEGEVDFVILMMHFGLDDQVEKDLGRGYSYDKVVELKEFVDYFALGHYHLPYVVDDWVYNPGSLENTKMDEVNQANGFFNYDDGAEFIEVNKTREFENIRIELGGYGSRDDLLDKFEREKKRIGSKDYRKEPIVNVVFEGDLRFERDELPIEEVEEVFSEVSLYVNTNVRVNREEIEFDRFKENKRRKIEKKVLKKLIERNRPNLENNSEVISETLIETKNMAVKGSGEDVIKEIKDCFDVISSNNDSESSDEGNRTWNWREAY